MQVWMLPSQWIGARLAISLHQLLLIVFIFQGRSIITARITFVVHTPGKPSHPPKKSFPVKNGLFAYLNIFILIWQHILTEVLPQTGISLPEWSLKTHTCRKSEAHEAGGSRALLLQFSSLTFRVSSPGRFLQVESHVRLAGASPLTSAFISIHISSAETKLPFFFFFLEGRTNKSFIILCIVCRSQTTLWLQWRSNINAIFQAGFLKLSAAHACWKQWLEKTLHSKVL